MPALAVSPPFAIFPDIDGNPLDNGAIYIGVAGLPAATNPISVFFDEALSVPAAQPVTVKGGYPMNGSTRARLFVNSDYSIDVRNVNGTTVFSALESTDILSADLITFIQAGANAVQRTVQSKLRDTVSVKDFGAVGDGVTNDTAAIQAALDAAQSVYFPSGNYSVDTLYVRNFNNAELYGTGVLYKRSDGNLMEITRSGVLIETLRFDGRTFAGVSKTGHNIVCTGMGLQMLNVTSVSAAGRALWSKNGSNKIIGGNYTTSDATASGYDIELGDGGTTSSLYNFVSEMATNQSTGGIFANTAELRISLCQIGKLASTGNGILQAFACRIIGNVQIGASGSVISGCNLAGSTLQLLSTTADCYIVNNALAGGLTITNAGNQNTFIQNNVSAGSYPIMEYGVTGSGGRIAFNQGSYFGFSRPVVVVNGLKMYPSNSFESGAPFDIIGVNASGAVFFGTGLSFVQHTAASAHQFFVGGNLKAEVTANGVCPGGNTAFITQGNGTPEGAVTAPVGSLFLRLDGGAGTTLYVKESGTGNTGWVAK